MAKEKIDWDPSWDDDWMQAQGKLEDEIEDEHPKDPEQAVELYRYGFVRAHGEPARPWSDIESDLYQDYMTGEFEETEETTWEHAREWARRGWEAGMER